MISFPSRLWSSLATSGWKRFLTSSTFRNERFASWPTPASSRSQRLRTWAPSLPPPRPSWPPGLSSRPSAPPAGFQGLCSFSQQRLASTGTQGLRAAGPKDYAQPQRRIPACSARPPPRTWLPCASHGHNSRKWLLVWRHWSHFSISQLLQDWFLSSCYSPLMCIYDHKLIHPLRLQEPFCDGLEPPLKVQ